MPHKAGEKMKTFNIRISPKAQIFLTLAVVLYFLLPQISSAVSSLISIGFGEVDPTTNSMYVVAIDPDKWSNIAVAKRIPDRIAGYRLYINGEEVLPDLFTYSDGSGIPQLVWAHNILFFTAEYDSTLWFAVPDGSPLVGEVPLISRYIENGPQIYYISDITRWHDNLYFVGYVESEELWNSNVYLYTDGEPELITDSGHVVEIAGGPKYLAVEEYYCLEASFCGYTYLISEETMENQPRDREIQYWDLHYTENPRWIGPFLWVTRGEYHPYFGIPDTITMPRQ